jgi:hypothetical protein
MNKQSSILSALVLAIVPAVAIYWLTQGVPSWLSKKTPEPAGLTFDGRVIDAATQRLLSGAEVVVEVAGVSTVDTTDSNGSYLFELGQATVPAGATLTVRAQGYQDYVRNLGPNLPNPLPDIALQPQSAPASPAAPGSPATAQAPKAVQTELASQVPHKRRKKGKKVNLANKTSAITSSGGLIVVAAALPAPLP